MFNWINIALFIINTVAIIAALWLSWKAVNAGYLMNNKYFGMDQEQMEMRWIIIRSLVGIVTIGLLIAILNILFI